jgi:hypothetical protein
MFGTRAVTVALASTLALAGCGDGNSPLPKFSVAVIGDMPYGASPTDTVEFNANPAFISAVNADSAVSVVLHAGDIHSGKEYCTQAYDQSIAQQWAAFKAPLVYTPGDNEWMDCHKKKEGGGLYNAGTTNIDYVQVNGQDVGFMRGDPLANLDLVRSIFFATPGKTLGQTRMTVHTQAVEFDPAHVADKRFGENVWFEKSGVLFATVNVPGGSNNGTFPWYGVPTMGAAQLQEVADRTGATLRWLDTVYSKAKSNGDTAMVIMVQGDMWDLDSNAMAYNGTLSELKQYIDKVASLTASFGKPVLWINGDSHLYRSDNPLVKDAPCAVEIPSTTGSKSTVTTSCANSVASGALHSITAADPFTTVQDKTNPSFVPAYNAPNFHRLVVHGSATASNTDKEYLRLTVDPSINATPGENGFGPFSWVRVQP